MKRGGEEESSGDEGEDTERTQLAQDGSGDSLDDLSVQQGSFEGKELRRLHSSWDEWGTYRAEYCEEENAHLVVQEAESVLKRNKQLRDSKRAKSGRDVRYLPEDLPRWRRRYICTHGSRARRRGTGKRLRGTGCPFRFTVESVFFKGKWVVEVKTPIYTHNHALSEVVYENYPQNRHVPMCEPLVEVLRLMVRAGGKGFRIYEYIRDHSSYKVTKQDVSNLLVKIRKELRGEAVDDLAVAEFLVEFGEEDKDNVISVDDTSSGETGAISLTTGRMRTVFAKFPELLLVDYMTSLMVMDAFGRGQFVQHAMIETNSDWHMRKVLTHFKTANVGWDALRVVMVDKGARGDPGLNTIRL
ncbi:hypothetical protein GQ600_13073 [Phytophthora cactorum]|nr:hypothetical protein GQ600_13073 [Phytophthora cactorum]